MYFKSTLLLGSLCASLAFLSCSKEPDDPYGSALPPSGVGSVRLYDEFTNRLPDAGMRVYIENSVPLTLSEAITDSNGQFVLNNIPIGTFHLVYEKEGYGTYKSIHTRSAVNTASTIFFDVTPSLGKISSTRITDLQLETRGDSILLHITTDPPGFASRLRYVRLLFSTDSNIDHQHFESFTAPTGIGINPFTKFISMALLRNLGFQSGQTVYIRAYGDSYFTNEYFNYATRESILPNLNADAAPAVSLVIP